MAHDRITELEAEVARLKEQLVDRDAEWRRFIVSLLPELREIRADLVESQRRIAAVVGLLDEDGPMEVSHERPFNAR